MIWRLPCVSRTETLFPYTPGCRAVEAGLATWSDGEPGGMLIVRGQAKLLEDVTAVTDLEHIRALFEALEKKEALLRLIDAADGAEGVQIRSEEHTSELQSLMRISYAVFCLKKKT